MDSVEQYAPQHPPIKWNNISLSFLLVCILLTAVLAGIGGFWLGARMGKSTKSQLMLQSRPAMISPTPTLYPLTTPNPLANWQTYADSTYGFSFKYPSHWSAPLIGMQNGSSTYANPDEYYVYFSVSNTINHSSNHYPASITMEIKVDRNVNNWTLNEWFYTHANGYDPQTVPQKVSSINDYQSIQARIVPDFENDFVVAPLSERGTINGLYEFILYGSTSKGVKSPYSDIDPFVQQELTNFHKVLSSFRFEK